MQAGMGAVVDAEIAIVGGGPSGIATALFLAHADPQLAKRIVVLEKASYPRDKFCGGAIGKRADDLLAAIGVRVDVPSVEVSGFSVRSRDAQVSARRTAIGRVVRRIEFDRALAEQALARGIRIEQSTAVTELAISEREVALETSQGRVRARAVIGADGVGSFVRRALGFPPGKLRAQVIELDTEPVAGDLARDLLHFDIADQDFSGYAWDFPTIVDGRELVCRGVYHLKLDEREHEPEVDIRARLDQRLRERGLDIARYKQKRFAERGFEPHQPYAAARVALVGEAAGIDAVTGEGIAQAIQYGAFAGAYLAEKARSGDYRFNDWNSRLARERVGIDLRIRHWLLPYYFGRHRVWLERHFTMRPEIIGNSVEQFGGLPVSNLSAMKAAASGAVSWLASNLRRRDRP
jgi:flavin-dependent dehydrogenase